ncbi:hypothetical protein FJZ31_10020 [Candidatus Poribacteria bacterium]|nr:hypothetical protein [Candidatus Poribacteria bacterium]
MQRKPLPKIYFILATLLIFIVNCAKAPQVIEAPKPVEQPAQVIPKPVEPQPAVQPAQPQSTIIGKDGAEMILIPAGEFIMGVSRGETNIPYYEHLHRQKVFLNAFYIDRCEATNAQYKQFMDATGHAAPAYWNDEKFNQPNQPVVGVSWHDAVAYCKWAGKRLPTEAEWEKAARGIDGRMHPWGYRWGRTDRLKCNANAIDDGYQYTAPVGSFPNGASPYGVMDMLGNVGEWVAKSVVRGGGAWKDNPNRLFCASHVTYEPTITSSSHGFRCAQDVTP